MLKTILSILAIGVLFLATSKISSAANQSLVTPTPTSPIDYILPFPGILPDHPLYFIKNLRDRILLAMTRNTLKKSEYLLLFSDKHLAMGKLLIEDKKEVLGSETLIKGENYLISSLDRLSESKGTGIFPPGYIEKIGLSAKKHQEVLNNLLPIVSDTTSINNLKRALLINSEAFIKVSEIGLPGK